MKNIMLLGEFEDAVFYRAACDCTNKDCDLELFLENDSGEIDLTISGDFVFDRAHFRGYKWYSRWWQWFKAVVRLIFTGRIEISTDFIFGSKDQVNDFIKALSRGVDKMNSNNLK